MGTNLSTLETSLLAAKKLTDFVNHGTKNVNESQLLTAQQMAQKQGNAAPKAPTLNMKPHSNITEEKIKSSGLPENIKKIMIENPIPDFSLNSVDRLSDDFIENVASKMNDQNYTVNGMRSTSNSQIKTKTSSEPLSNNSLGIDIPSPNSKQQTISENKKVKKNDFKTLVKETIREVLDELLEEKSKELFLESKNVKDTLQIKVGKSVFYGKINKIKTQSKK